MKAWVLFRKVFVNSRSVRFHHMCDVKEEVITIPENDMTSKLMES